jgi:guanylate kinase
MVRLTFGASTTGVGNFPQINAAPGRFVLVSGPSGVGKGTILKELFKDPEMQGKLTQVTSLKTRPPRPGEVGSPDSRSITEQEFLQLKQENKLFQWTRYDGNWYGSAIDDVMAKLNQGKVVIFEMTAEVALMMKKKFPTKVSTVFLTPPAPMFKTLRERLLKRGTNDEASIQTRLKQARSELRLRNQFDKQIVSENGKIQQAVDQLKAFIKSQQPQLFGKPPSDNKAA